MREWTTEAPNLSGALEMGFELDEETTGIRGSTLAEAGPFTKRRKPMLTGGRRGEFWLVQGLASSEQIRWHLKCRSSVHVLHLDLITCLLLWGVSNDFNRG